MATTLLEVKNNATGQLDSGITDVATTLTLGAGEGALFPSAFPFHISIDDEIIEVGARSVDVLSSLIRAQQGTTAAAHSASAAVELRLTAKHVSDLNTLTLSLEGFLDGGVKDQYLRTGGANDPDWESLGFDRVIASGEDLDQAFADGANSVLALDGTHALSQDTTIPAGGKLWGQSRDGTIIEPGAFRLIGSDGSIQRDFTVKDGTNAISAAAIRGTWEHILFDGNERAATMSTIGVLRGCLFKNFQGAAGDYYVDVGGLTFGWLIEGNLFDGDIFGTVGGPAVKIANTIFGGAKIRGNFCFMPDSPAYPEIDLGSNSAVVIATSVVDNTFFTHRAGSPGANGGLIDIGSSSSTVSIRGNECFLVGSPTAKPEFAVRITGADGTIVTNNPFKATQKGIILRANGCIIQGNPLGDDASGTNEDGILVDGDYDDNIISGNIIKGFTTGINVSSALAQRNIIAQNNLKTNTTPLVTQPSTQTQTRDNITA